MSVALERENEWLDSRVPALSDSEDESITITAEEGTPIRSSRISYFTKLRQIAFKAFTTKPHSTRRRSSIVTSTEIIIRQENVDMFGQRRSSSRKNSQRQTIFKSLKFKSGGSTRHHTKKMSAVLKNSIRIDSPLELQPKTWDEYSRLYASEKIDIQRPPLPPCERDNREGAPSVFQARYFAAPIPANESVRQLVMNRIDVFGGKRYDDTEEGIARWKQRVEMGEKMMREGKGASSFISSWADFDSSLRNGLGVQTNKEIVIDRAIPSDYSASQTLEQHPILRMIVNQCRELFSASFSLICVVDDERQVVLAESGLPEAGLGGVRDFPRDMSLCGHTILGGRKGLTVLDTRKDWRFENNPTAQSFGPMFYAGVPLMSPNMDGSKEAEKNACPLGALCVASFEPRESFSLEDRKRLVYMSEYARREIASWFARKMEQKQARLLASEDAWTHEVKMVAEARSDKHSFLKPEAFSDALSRAKSPISSPNPSGSKGLRGIRSIFNYNYPTWPSLNPSVPLKAPAQTSAGLFEDFDAVLNPQVRKVMDLATRLIGETLDLSLVYLTAVLPPDRSDQPGRTKIVSGHNIPIPVPVFDAGLHLRALREPEGGLLYQNPSSSERAVLQPKTPAPGHDDGRRNPYASAMIFAVSHETHDDSGGFVLAGYTDNPKRVFGAEDAAFMKKFAEELSCHTSKLQLSSSSTRR